MAFDRLDAIVQRAGGAEALMADPEKIPQVHIRGDVQRPVALRGRLDLPHPARRLSDRRFISNPVDPAG